MMTSPKEKSRQQISDYDIFFIKGGWLVDKSNKPLPFVNQENKEEGVESTPPPLPSGLQTGLMNNLNNTMKRIYSPTENLSLDEPMVFWRGRLTFRQYIKEKKHKYGAKFYELCESDGFILGSFIYSGLPCPETLDLRQTGAIVLKLMEDF